MKELILYHGSRKGLSGPIAPISRDRCDFGRGFYMGEQEMQTASLVMNEPAAVVYTLRVTLSDDIKILNLTDTDWLYTVLSCRRRVPEFNQLAIADQCLRQISNADLVIGKIADDQMNEAMKSFISYAMSDAGLYECLSKVSYGNQYVARTDFMCKKITILNEKAVTESSYPGLGAYISERRAEGKNIIRDAMIKNRTNGLYLDQIIERETKK